MFFMKNLLFLIADNQMHGVTCNNWAILLWR